MNELELLQLYLKINTGQPKPDYESAVNFFEQITRRDGFETQKVILPSGLPVLIISYIAIDSKLPALALNHHIDTVDVQETSQWSFSPLAGIVNDGKVYGRGTQDMKGVGVAHYAALRELKKNKVNLKRPVHMFLVPDEEVGGFNGTKQFIETVEFKKLNIGFVLDEGLPSGDDDLLFIKISERKPIQIRLTSVGINGHSSKLHANNCVHELINILGVFIDHQEDQKQKCNLLTEAGKFLSINVTSFITHESNNFVSLNVIPSKAIATIDMRVPTTIPIDNVYKFLHEIMEKFPTISYEVLAVTHEESFLTHGDTEFYLTLKEVIDSNGFNSQPLHFEASTDLRFYLDKGIQGLGFTPFSCAANLHGIDESIRIKDLIQGKKIFYDFIKKFCC